MKATERRTLLCLFFAGWIVGGLASASPIVEGTFESLPVNQPPNASLGWNASSSPTFGSVHRVTHTPALVISGTQSLEYEFGSVSAGSANSNLGNYYSAFNAGPTLNFSESGLYRFEISLRVVDPGFQVRVVMDYDAWSDYTYSTRTNDTLLLSDWFDDSHGVVHWASAPFEVHPASVTNAGMPPSDNPFFFGIYFDALVGPADLASGRFVIDDVQMVLIPEPQAWHLALLALACWLGLLSRSTAKRRLIPRQQTS